MRSKSYVAGCIVNCTRASARTARFLLANPVSACVRALDGSLSIRHYAGHGAIRENELVWLAALALEPAAAPWLNASIAYNRQKGHR